MNKILKIAIPVAVGVVAIGAGTGAALAKNASRNVAANPASLEVTPTPTPDSKGVGFCGGQAGGMMGQTLKVTEDRIASRLGLTTADLEAQLKAGKTLSDLAGEKGVSQDDLATTLLGPMNDQMAVMVKYGYLSQDQANAMLQGMRSWADKLTTTKISYFSSLMGSGMMGSSNGMMGSGSGSSGGMTGSGTNFGGMMGSGGTSFGGMMGSGGGTTGKGMMGSGGGMMGW